MRTRFANFYWDPMFLPRTRTQALRDILPAVLYALRSR